MITNEDLQLIAQLRHEAGYTLLCDHLQALVDDLADRMAADDLPSDIRLARLLEWKAARKLVATLIMYPAELAKDLAESKTDTPPPELTVDRAAITRQILAQQKLFPDFGGLE